MSTPAVSVVTPTRNRAGLLIETLDSVAAQTLGDWEHIVVDDGSDDGTAELMAARTAEDGRVRYMRREGDHPGANVCRNIGVKAAAAPYIVLLDSDDLLAPGCLARRVEVISQNLDMDFVTFQAGLFERTPGDLGTTANADGKYAITVASGCWAGPCRWRKYGVIPEHFVTSYLRVGLPNNLLWIRSSANQRKVEGVRASACHLWIFLSQRQFRSSIIWSSARL